MIFMIRPARQYDFRGDIIFTPERVFYIGQVAYFHEDDFVELYFKNSPNEGFYLREDMIVVCPD